MHGRCMTNDELDRADIHAQCYRIGSLLRPISSEFYQPFPIKLIYSKRTELTLEHLQSSVFGTARRLAGLLHVVDVQVDQCAEDLGVAGAAAGRRVATIDFCFCFRCPCAGMIVPKKGSGRLVSLKANLDLPVT